MATAIIIIVLLGLLDTMLYLACMELEKYKEIDDERERQISDR